MSNSKHNQAETQNRNTILYGIAIGAVVVIAVVMMIWNSNFFQRRATAVTINGTNYNAADVAYYYANTRQYYYYMAMMGMATYDSTKDADDQMYDVNTTWHQFFCQEAIDSLRKDIALYDQAMEEGYTISEETQAEINADLASMESSRLSSGYSNRNSFAKAIYGSIMTYDDVVHCLTRAAIASDFSSAHNDSLTYTQDELNAYYAENKDTLDTYTVSQFLFPVSDPTIDSEGNTVEMTEEEEAAALETAKQNTKNRADELLAQLNAGTDPETLMDRFADDLGYSFVSNELLGSSLSSYYSEWCQDSQRQANDATVIEYDSASSTYYCVVRFEKRVQDNTPSVNIRHALIEAGSDPTDEEYEEAKVKAEELLEQWKTDGATEEGFAKLAEENSADTSSATDGGLLNVTPYSNYGEAFSNWALNEGHTSGDTGLVKNDFSSTKGYHIMYYVGEDLSYWAQSAQSSLRSEDQSAWEEELLTDYTAEEGSGMKYVG